MNEPDANNETGEFGEWRDYGLEMEHEPPSPNVFPEVEVDDDIYRALFDEFEQERAEKTVLQRIYGWCLYCYYWFYIC